MALDGTTIAAIVTGILALLAALTTAWMSGWNEERKLARANKTALSRHSVHLIIAAWDLANWFYDALDDNKYHPDRCQHYGEDFDRKFTSYLLGQYFAAVHVVREMTHFFSHMRSKEAEKLKKLLWKIQDEFVSTYYGGWESVEMRWSIAHILTVQEHLTKYVDSNGTGRESRAVGWLEFCKKYDSASESGSEDSPELRGVFKEYEDDYERIFHRRFAQLYATKWLGRERPENIKDFQGEEKSLGEEKDEYPNINAFPPDHRFRRLQHLLSDLVALLDKFTATKLNRPMRKCEMLLEREVFPSQNPLGLETEARIPCDCKDKDCNPRRVDFEHRQLPKKRWKSCLLYNSPEATQKESEDASPEESSISERSMV